MNAKLAKHIRSATRRQQPDAARRYVATNGRKRKTESGVEYLTATLVNAPGTQRRVYRDAKVLFGAIRRKGRA